MGAIVSAVLLAAALTPTGPALASAPDPRAPPPPMAVPAAADDLFDGVLPCGLRVLVARDPSFAVTALELVVPLGIGDADLPPGHATWLAYQALEGNRRMPPGGLVAFAHDAGGYATLAQTWGRTRYEIVVPTAVLDDALDLLASLFTPPAVTSDTLRRAHALAAMAARRLHAGPIPPSLRAAVYGEPAPPQGAVPDLPAGPALETLAGRVRADMGRFFTPERAVLVVVTNLPRAEILPRIERTFAGLPRSPRHVPATGRAGHAPAARRLGPPQDRATWLLSPLPPGPHAREAARVLCRALNRHRPKDRKARRFEATCHLDTDPDRPLLQIRTRGVAPRKAAEALERRIAALLHGDGRPVFERERAIVAASLAADAGVFIGLARRLAERPPFGEPPADRADAIGTGRLADPDAAARLATRLVEALRWSYVPPAFRPRGAPKKPPRTERPRGRPRPPSTKKRKPLPAPGAKKGGPP